MRAARAAATRGEADTNTTFRRPSDYRAIARSKRATPTPKRQSSRSGVGLLSGNLRASASASLSEIAQPEKTKRIPRGTAVKRPRAFVRTATAGGQADRQHEADSRFPMPYPGADRDLQQPGALQAAQMELSETAGAGRQQHRKAHRVEGRGPESAAGRGGNRRRTRPKSASVARVSPENHGQDWAKGHSHFRPSPVRQTQDVSKVPFVKEQGQTRASKRPRRVIFLLVSDCHCLVPDRPMSAPPARGKAGDREKRGVGRRNGEVLLALSHMSGGSSCAPSELRIMKWVVLRETYLTKLRGVVSADRKRAKSNAVSKSNQTSSSERDHKRRSPQLFALLTELLTVLRRITVEIVEAVERWRRGEKDRPFVWGSSNYLLKAACDTEFLSRLPGLEQHLGVTVSRNPFLSQTCLDGRSAVLDRFSIRSQSGAFPLGDSGSLGVSEERIAAAAAVLFREVRRERRRMDGRERERERSHSEERRRFARSPADRRRRPIVFPPRRSRVEYEQDKRFGALDGKASLRHGGGRPKIQQSADAAVVATGDPYNADHRRRGDRRFDAPDNVEARRDSRPSEEPSRPFPCELSTANDRQLSEERHDLQASDDDRLRRASRSVRRRSSTASDLTQAESASRHSQPPPRRSSSHGNPAVDEDPGRPPPPHEERHDRHPGITHRDDRRATEVYRVHSSPSDGGRKSADRADRRWSTGSGDPRSNQRGPRRSLPFYPVAENGCDEPRDLPPDDQSLDYQNGGVVYRDQCYDEDEVAAYGDDDQHLNYYYQEGGYYAYAEDDHQEGHDTDGISGTGECLAGRSNPDGDRMGSPNEREQEPTGTEACREGARILTSGEAHKDNSAAGSTTFAPPSDRNLVEPQLEPGTNDPKDQQDGEATRDAPARVVVVPTGPLPAAEETGSCDDQDPPDGSHGRMGRRGSPFNLIFNMCDGMLTDLKDLGMGDRTVGMVNGTDEVQPSTLDNPAGTRDEGSFAVPTVTDVEREEQQEDRDSYVPPVFQTTRHKSPVNSLDGRGAGEPPPPALRGATYASLTRKIVATSKEGWPEGSRVASGGDSSDAELGGRTLTDFFSAWAERTEGRLRHRDTKAAKHYRVGRLRWAMSAWEAHRARLLGSRMAEAFAGSFGLSSRFFVRFTFDALRAHAKGARVAVRNRAVIGTFVSRMDRFGRARLRQAFRRWALPIMGQGYWGEEGSGALEKLCRHWSRGRLRAALDVWQRRRPRQPEPDSEPVRPPLHAARSFATLKGKLKAAGSFATLKGAPPTPTASKTRTAVSNGSRRQEGSSTATDGKDEDSWAEWLGNEGSISVVSPDGERKSQRAAPAPSAQEPILARNDSNAATKGASVLSPSRSFRGLGVALKSIKSFRDGRDKSQTQRPRLRATASFGSPPSPPSTSPTPPLPVSLDPAAADSATQVVDGLQVQHFAANCTKLRGEAARLKAREIAAATIQRALWSSPRERQIAARVSRSALLIQELWRLRSRRRRAGYRLVRAWRARVRARVVTLNRALHEAAEEGDLRAVAFLLRPSTSTATVSGLGLSVGFGGADTNATAGTAKETALHAAASSGGAGRSNDDNRNLPAKSRKKSSIPGRGELATSSWTIRAAERRSGQSGNYASVDENGQPGTSGDWLKGKGCSPDWVGVIRALVNAGAMIEARDGRGFTPMMTAAEEGSKETVAALAALGGEVDVKESRGGKRTPLVIAAQTANAPAAAALLEYGARANLTIGDDLTPLHEAVGAGSTAVAEMLVRAGANVNATNKSAGMTPLHLAVANDQHAAARLLVHSGANVCLPDSRGLTCLRLTVEMADAPTVALLLAAEPPADLSVKDENGGTVLHAACRLGLTDIAQLLLDHGSDPHVRDARGRTPELVALDLGHSDCAGLFYNVDIHSYAPDPSNNHRRERSTTDAAGGEGRQERGEDGVGGSDVNDNGRGERRETAEGEGQRDDRDEGDDAHEDGVDNHTDRDGGEGEGARINGKLRESFDMAIEAARRASSVSTKEHEDQTEAAEGRGREGSRYVNDYPEGAEDRQHAEGAWSQVSYEREGEGDGNVGTGGFEREWPKTNEWANDTGNVDGVDDPAAQATPAAAPSGSNGGPLDATDAEHDTSYNQTEQENEGQQRYSPGQGIHPSYDDTDGGVGNEKSQAYQENPAYLEPSSWEGYHRSLSVELPKEEGRGGRGEYDASNVWEASSGAARALSRVGEEQEFVLASACEDGVGDDNEEAEPDQGSSAVASHDESAFNPEYLEDGAATAGVSKGGGNSMDVVGWGSAIALAKASSRWISLLDRSSGSVYYQNEQSGSTQWEVPEGAVVIAAPEDG
ncbi:unnamed protein product [Scytosiphon promiscuus]